MDIIHRRLYQASVGGDVNTLHNLIQENPLILEKAIVITCLEQTPLHIAASLGHLEFTRELLSLNANLATKFDLCGRSPLHWASEKGHVKIVRELLLHVSDGVCFHGDKDKMIPLHLAAMQGHEKVIQELIRAQPESTMVRLDNEESVLHLCVKNNRLEALKLLVEMAVPMPPKGHSLVRAKDNDGNTVLHVAARSNQTEIIKYLLSMPEVKEIANDKNEMGFTALDESEQSSITDSNSMEVQTILSKARVQRVKIFWQRLGLFAVKYLRISDEWLKESRGNFLTMATVIATMSFQAGIAPPGSVWQDDDSSNSSSGDDNNNKIKNEPGRSIIATKEWAMHSYFVFFNTISLAASLIVINLLISGVPLKNSFSKSVLSAAVYTSILCIALTYSVSINMMSPTTEKGRVIILTVCYCAAYAGYVVLFCVILTYTYEPLVNLLQNLQSALNRWCFSRSKPPGPGPDTSDQA